MVATQLKRHRVAAGFTQLRLADAVGVSRQAVVEWQRGAKHPYARNARKLEAVLGAPIAVLLAPENTNDPDAKNAEVAERKQTTPNREVKSNRVTTE